MLVDTAKAFEELRPALLSCTDPVVDVESKGTNIFGSVDPERELAEVIGIAVDIHYDAYYFPFRHMEGRNLSIPKIMPFFRDYLSNPHRLYGGFNYNFDEHAMYIDGIQYAPNYEDAMLALHLLNENEPNFQLKDTCDRYGIGDGSLQESLLKDKVIAGCKAKGIKVSEDKKSAHYWKGKMAVLPAKDVEPYATDDVRLTRQLLEMLKEALRAAGLYEMWKEVCYYSYISGQMERRGLQLDVPLIEKYSKEATGHAEKALAALHASAGYELNPNSPNKVCAFLGGTKSSDAETLDTLIESETEYADKARLVRDARGWLSVESRYYTPYLAAMDSDGVLHPNLNIIGTISGRLSCYNPNLQAVARKTEVFKVKDVFVSRPGFTLVSADYSQAEMRLASYYAKEETMTELIRNGADIHSATADTLGIPRDAAKRINFGVIYRIGAEALHKQIHTDKKTAQDFLNQYHGMYPQFKRLAQSCEHYAEDNGVIEMWTGRQRHFNSPKADPYKAMSNLIQGGVAEIMRVTITRLYPMIYEIGGHMILQVHDQVIFEIPDEQLKYALPAIKVVMEDFEFNPAMTVDITIGKRWGELKEWNP